MEELFQFLNSIRELSPGLTDYLKLKLKHKKIRKGDILLKPGQVCTNIYFIEKGLFRCYYIKEKREVCTWFMAEGDVIVSVTSFFQQQPSYEFIHALEDASVYYITYDELQEAYNIDAGFNYNGREILTKYYLLSEERLVCIRNSTGMQKVAFLYKHYTGLVERGVEYKYLATYLDMRAEYFSACNKAYLKTKRRKRKN